MSFKTSEALWNQKQNKTTKARGQGTQIQVRCQQIRFGIGFAWSYRLVDRGLGKGKNSFTLSLSKIVLMKNLHELKCEPNSAMIYVRDPITGRKVIR